MRTVCAALFRYALPTALLATAIPAGLTAQEPEEESRECVCVSELPEMRVMRPFIGSNRARIGVLLGDRAEVDGRAGVTVEEVTPGGPAAGAGLQAEDIILDLDGQELGEEAPARDLLDAMGDVEPGDTIIVGYARGGERRTARVVAEDTRDLSVVVARSRPGREAFRFEMPSVGVAPRVMGETPIVWRGFFGADVELVDLNPRLGQYFSADEGVLVVDLDDDSTLGLEPGDVILAIDGREVRSAEHARSILRSYAPDEPITFRIVRDQRQVEASGTRGN